LGTHWEQEKKNKKYLFLGPYKTNPKHAKLLSFYVQEQHWGWLLLGFQFFSF